MAKGKYEKWLTQESLLKIQGWARDGLTDDVIADNIGISRSTLYEWKRKYTDISDALKESKEVADRKVENALFNSAVGFVGPDGKYYPPNITAMIFWLKNRKPNNWRDMKHVDANLESIKKLDEILGGIDEVMK